MKYWWVNQNQTYKHEVAGGYLWSPKVKVDGSRNHFYDTMSQAQPGDLVFSFCDTLIKAIGIVTGHCESAPRPDEFGSAGAYWNKEGWLLPVVYHELAAPVRPKSHIDLIRPTLPSKYSPLQGNGNGNQVVYLTEVPTAMAAVLIDLIGQLPTFEEVPLDTDRQLADDKEEARIASDTTIPETEKLQLSKARRGQGLFRRRLELVEQSCRVTGVAFKPLLRASHTKPWRDCTNAEKLDGNNGLLLAPHVDVLFDQGFISFTDEGSLLVSPLIPSSVMDQLGIDVGRAVGSFSPAQCIYLAYHRAHIFKQAAATPASLRAPHQ